MENRIALANEIAKKLKELENLVNEFNKPAEDKIGEPIILSLEMRECEKECPQVHLMHVEKLLPIQKVEYSNEHLNFSTKSSCIDGVKFYDCCFYNGKGE